MVVDATSSVCHSEVLDSLNGDAVQEIMEGWNGFCLAAEALLKNGNGDLSWGSNLVSHARTLCSYGLKSLVEEHFAGFLEVSLVSHYLTIFSGRCDCVVGSNLVHQCYFKGLQTSWSSARAQTNRVLKELNLVIQ